MVDLSRLLETFKIKNIPEGPGLSIDQLAADFDHRQAGSPYVGYYRVGTTDACIFFTYFGIKEWPKGLGISPDCTECETPGSGLQGPQLSLRVSVEGEAFQDTDTLLVDSPTLLRIGINNTTDDKVKWYDGYISITNGHEYGDWTGNSWVYDADYFHWTYYGTYPVADKDTWCMETANVSYWTSNPSNVSSWNEYMYDGNGTVIIKLYNEFFEPVDTLTIQGGCYAGMPDYDEWVSVGSPDCWCYRKQCNGDATGTLEGNTTTGHKWVFNGDLGIFLAGFGVKEPPKGPGILSVTNGICADFTHTVEGNSTVGYKRVFNGDLGIFLANFGVKEPPKGPGIPECPGLFYYIDPYQ